MASNIDYISFFFDNPHIFDLILSSLPHIDLIQCSRTSKQMYAATNNYNLRAFDIDNHLAHHFNHPTDFCSLQRQTGVIISSSNAIQFFDRTKFIRSDLDLYVTDSFASQVGQWLTNNEEYDYYPQEGNVNNFDNALKTAILKGPPDKLPGEPYNNSGIVGVFNFKKKERLIIQLIYTNISPIHAILSFHSST